MAAATGELLHQNPASAMQGCSGKKGVVYDFFFQYGPSVLLTNSDYWINFDAGYDTSLVTGQSLHMSVKDPTLVHIVWDSTCSLLPNA